MKNILILIAVFFFSYHTANPQEPLFPVINYTTKDYGRDFHPTNMAVVQDQRGIIYAANGFKLLEFDGRRWNAYPINKEAWILSLAIDTNGIIYTGSQNEFGFFSPDTRGELRYHSLSDSLDLNEMDFSNIWKVHTCKEGVIFQAEEKIFLYRKGETVIIKPRTSFHTSFNVGERIYVRERGNGLMELQNGALIPVAGSEIFDTTGVFLMVPYGKESNRILIGTREKGFWVFNPENSENSFRRFRLSDEESLKKAIITGGTVTERGLVAISTMTGGVMVIDTSGRTVAIVDKSKGLGDNDVKEVIWDQERNLWTALNNGISMIGISSPVSFYGESSGVTGSVNSIVSFGTTLYAGTTTGLLVYESDNTGNKYFRPVRELSAPVRNLLVADGLLIAATDDGIFKAGPGPVARIDDVESYTLFYSPELKILLSGGPKGLRAYEGKGFSKELPGMRIEGEDIIGISEEIKRTDGIHEIWIGTRYNGAIRIRLNGSIITSSDSYNINDGLPYGPVIPSSIGSRTVFETIRGLYFFTDENIVRESLPDSLKDNKDFLRGYFSILPDINRDIGASVSFIRENSDKIWICSDNKVGYLDKKKDRKYVSRQFNVIDAGKINTIYPGESGICWIGATEGLFRYDENHWKDYDRKYCTVIRKVTLIEDDSAIFLGTAGLSRGDITAVDFRNNSIRFDYSSSFFEQRDKNLFSYMLSGRNSKWSLWSSENFQEFTNLREGTYLFSVKSMNVFGTESSVAEYRFRILPPWYRTLAAYTGYSILFIVLLWMSARIYSYRLKRENIRLEGIITERTAEIVRQKDEITTKNTVLEHQKKEIEDSIKYASRIQSAVIPTEKTCREIIPESFVLFRPLSIVSGDFYWISSKGDRVIYTAADCTGHGVPGAFMSMLGVAFLNEIVNKDNITSPDQILNHLRNKVIQALQQQGASGETRDGMDIALISIDLMNGSLEFAGAYNPLIMIRNGEIFETRGDKMPVGYYEKMHDFTKHEIKIEKGDTFYMYSDGYEDQFGGPDGKKFKSKRLKSLLLDIYRHPVAKQKEILEQHFEDWKGDLPQVDDIVLAGVVIK